MKTDNNKGIFVPQPYHPNIKCVIFSSVLVAAYIFTSCKPNYLMTVPIFIASYVAMAWYDKTYNCGTPLKTGTAIGPGTIDSIFKPQNRNYNGEGAVNQEEQYLNNVYLFHVLLVAPLMIYIGIKKQKTQNEVFSVLASFGIIAGLYHSYRLIQPRETN